MTTFTATYEIATESMNINTTFDSLTLKEVEILIDECDHYAETTVVDSNSTRSILADVVHDFGYTTYWDSYEDQYLVATQEHIDFLETEKEEAEEEMYWDEVRKGEREDDGSYGGAPLYIQMDKLNKGEFETPTWVIFKQVDFDTNKISADEIDPKNMIEDVCWDWSSEYIETTSIKDSMVSYAMDDVEHNTVQSARYGDNVVYYLVSDTDEDGLASIIFAETVREDENHFIK